MAACVLMAAPHYSTVPVRFTRPAPGVTLCDYRKNVGTAILNVLEGREVSHREIVTLWL
jgi:hypothetical protein